MNSCRTRGKRTSRNHSKRRWHTSRNHSKCRWHTVGWTGPLALVASDPSDGATGVDRDITVELVFAREGRRRRRHFWDDCDHDWDHDFHDDSDDSVHQVIEAIDMWQGFDPVEVNVTRLTTARTNRLGRSDKFCRRDKWIRCGDWEKDWRNGCRNSDDRWDRGDRGGKAVFLVDPVSRLRADTKYKVRVKYLDISQDGCRKRKSADMIVFKTGKS